MKSIGKAMKVGRQTKASESDSLREALKNLPSNSSSGNRDTTGKHAIQRRDKG